MKRIFIIGPGGVGKTTWGKLFANKICCEFIDLDSEFINRIGLIESYIKEHGYRNYCRENSSLFYKLLEEQIEDTVFALSSGFLVYGNVDSELKKHRESIRDLGLSILLLPSESIDETEDIVVKRQLTRGLNYSEDRERKKIRERFDSYAKSGDLKIFSADSPESVADKMEYLFNNLQNQRAEQRIYRSTNNSLINLPDS
jgi:shikimate kinase